MHINAQHSALKARSHVCVCVCVCVRERERERERSEIGYQILDGHADQ
jgi:hypothetical protein